MKTGNGSSFRNSRDRDAEDTLLPIMTKHSTSLNIGHVDSGTMYDKMTNVNEAGVEYHRQGSSEKGNFDAPRGN